MIEARSWRALIAAALGVVVLLVAACGQEGGGGGASPAKPPPAMEAPPPPATSPLPRPSPGVAPPPTIALPAPGVFSAVDRAIEAMPLGNIAFNSPRTVQLGDSRTIELLLSLNQSVDELQAAIKSAGEKEGARIRVASRMEARLTGTNFRITAITPERQAITSMGVTRWKWEIEPTRAGQHRLHLTLSMLFEVNGTTTQRAVRTFDRTIDVQVTTMQRAQAFVAGNWQFLWTALLVPFIPWLWKKLRAKKPGR